MRFLSSEGRADAIAEGPSKERKELSVENDFRFRERRRREAGEEQPRNWKEAKMDPGNRRKES